MSERTREGVTTALDLVGMALVIWGVALLSTAAALIVAGLLLLAWSYRWVTR